MGAAPEQVGLGETIIQTASRGVLEETGAGIVVTGLVGIYTDPRRVIAFEGGPVLQEFHVRLHARAEIVRHGTVH